jgi:hypothetical protein
VTDGGGGTFTGVWTPAGHAQAGFYVTNTKTPGRVYELSAEHHIRARSCWTAWRTGNSYAADRGRGA